jgi:ribosomal protein S18 acetylase RimI-like enzyme
MSPSRFTIRPLGPDDAAAFKALRLQAIADAPAAVWPTHDEEAGLCLDEVRSRIAFNPNVVVFGAFDGATLLGIAGLRREALVKVAHKATLWGVFVAPGCRREGVARQLLDRALTHARAWGVLQLQLAVNTENERARALYGSLGFQSFGLEARALRVGNRFYDEEHMALRLDA